MNNTILDLSFRKKIKNCRYWFKKINQFYHPVGIFGAESQQFVYSYNLIGKTEFDPILIKELFTLIKVNGYLILDYHSSKKLSFQILEEYFWWLCKNKYEIIYHGSINQNEYSNITKEKLYSFIKKKGNKYNDKLIEENKNSQCMRFVCKKYLSDIKLNDSINKWTFGIITNGKRDDWIRLLINSIVNQAIPNYEIIICGTYNLNIINKNIRYIHFNQRDHLGWITKKKNLIASNAKYENLCIVHDRFYLEIDWFKKMKKWGNSFEFLWLSSSKPNIAINNHMVSYFRISKLAFCYILDNSSWSCNIFSGPIIVTKKRIYQDILLNETSYWGCNNNSLPEDLVFTYDSIRKGYLYRNPNEKFFNTLDERESIFGSGLIQKMIYCIFKYLGKKFEKKEREFLRPIKAANYYYSKNSSVSKIRR